MNAFGNHRLTPRPKSVSSGQISAGALVAAGAAVLLLVVGFWAYQHFVVALRLPQNRDLTIQGKTIQARLEACSNDLVKYILLADGTTRYAAIAKLSETDQDFIRQLPKTLILKFPFEMMLDQGDGQPVQARIEGHNADWMKYTLLSDHSTHYLPLTSLTPNDQVVVQQLPSYLAVEYPVMHSMTDLNGQFLPARIEGRSQTLVKLSTTDGAVSYYPISALSAVDQKLVALLPDSFTFYCPVECTLINQQGQKLSVRVEGRSANIVKYTLLSDGLVYYVPTSDFSAMDQQVLRELPSNMTFTFPIEYTISDAIGRPMRVRLEGRTSNLVKFTSLADGLVHYAPLTSFSAEDQDFLQLLPADLVVDFPLNYTLIALGGQPLEAHILGRDADSVKFQLADGKTYNYRLDMLADASQAFLRMLPANLVDASVQPEPKPVAAPVRVVPDVSPVLADLNAQRSTLADLITTNLRIQDAINHLGSGPAATVSRINTTGGIIASRGSSVGVFSANAVNGINANNREQLIAQIEANAESIETTCAQINNDLAQMPSPGGHGTVQSMWDQSMEIIKRSGQIRREIAGANPSEAQSLENQLLSTQKDLVVMLNRIYSQSGQYSP